MREGEIFLGIALGLNKKKNRVRKKKSHCFRSQRYLLARGRQGSTDSVLGHSLKIINSLIERLDSLNLLGLIVFVYDSNILWLRIGFGLKKKKIQRKGQACSRSFQMSSSLPTGEAARQRSVCGGGRRGTEMLHQHNISGRKP